MRRLVGARRSRTVRRACMFSATAAAVVALLVVAAPDTGTLANSSRLAARPQGLTGTQSPPVPAPSSPAPVGGASRPAAENHSAPQPAPVAAATTTSTSMVAGASPLAAGPEKIYGRQPAGAPPAPTSIVAPGCQGTTPLGLPGTWNCTFDDEFNGTTLNTNNWVPQETAASGFVNGATACYMDNPDTISVSGGDLNLTALQVPSFTCPDGSNSFTTTYEAGMVSTSGLFDQTYGAFEVSAKLPPSVVEGLQETMWLYPQNLTYGAWPDSGEIDFAEFYSEFPGLDVPYVHYSQSSTDPNVTSFDCLINQDSFNTYGVDWTPTAITVLYNGQPCLVDHPSTGSQPFDQPFFIALTQALGVGTNPFTPGVTELPATTQIDWVRAWSPAS
jgi:beta-glucanase (GH16 family)